MNSEQREKAADELATLAMTSLRAFLEGKARLQISQNPLVPGVGSMTTVRFVMDAGK